MKKIRVFIGVLGLDQHEVGAIAVARMLRDAGMEVIYAGMFNLPPTIVHTSLQEDVDVIGLSCHSWEYFYYVPELLDLLREKKIEIPIIIGGSVITPGDGVKLKEMGVAGVFGSASTDEQIVETIKRIGLQKN